MASVAWRLTNNPSVGIDQVTTVKITSITTPRTTSLTWPSTSPNNLDTLANELKASGCSLQLIEDLLAPAFHQEANRQSVATFLHLRSDQLPWPPAPEWKPLAVTPGGFTQMDETHSKRMSKIFGPLGKNMEEDERFNDWPRYGHSIGDNVYAGISPPLKAKLHQLREARSQELRRLRRLANRASDEIIHDQIVAMKSEQLNQLQISGSFDVTEIDEYALRISPYSQIVREVTGIELSDQEMRNIAQNLESSDGPKQISNLLV